MLDEGRPFVEKIYGEDIVFDLAALFVERSGYNLRNGVAHGLIGGRLDGGPMRHFFGMCLRLIFGVTPSSEETDVAKDQEVEDEEPPN